MGLAQLLGAVPARLDEQMTTIDNWVKGKDNPVIKQAERKAFTGKIMLASWRGTRFEVSQVLREVVDRVLKEQGVPDQVLYNRAKVRRPPRSGHCYVLTVRIGPAPHWRGVQVDCAG